MGIESFLIASTVQGVLSQRLLRSICNHCKEQTRADPRTLALFGKLGVEMRGVQLHQGRGCNRCGHSGFKGRIAIHELLVLNDSVRDGLFLRKTSSELRHLARTQADLISMAEDALYKALNGLTTLEEVLRVIPLTEAVISGARSLERILQQCTGGETGRSNPGIRVRPLIASA
jgi:type IV pilus assembly protein PilB